MTNAQIEASGAEALVIPTPSAVIEASGAEALIIGTPSALMEASGADVLFVVGAARVDKSHRSSGVATLGTTWGALVTDGSWDVYVAATVGDVIEVGVSTLWAPTSASYIYMDVAVIKDNAVAHWVSTGTTSHTNGLYSMFQNNSAEYVPSAGSWFYTVQSGDVVNGYVRFRLYGKTNTSTRAASLSAPAQSWAAQCDNGATVQAISTTALSSSSFTALTGTATVTAAAGDVIAVTLSGIVDNGSAGVVRFDAATKVSGSVVNWLSSGSSSQATGGVAAWHCSLGSYEPMTGTILYTVQAGDVVSGQVTIQIYGACSTGTRNMDTPQFAVRRV